MRCQWDALLSVLPNRIRPDVDKYQNELLLEIRLRIGQPPILIFPAMEDMLEGNVTLNEINQCIHYATRYSPWTATTQAQGYITAPGGHRIGICGTYVEGESGPVIREPSMLCIRIARDISEISNGLEDKQGSILILGRPGCGKTTLLRDLIRQYSLQRRGTICVVDEREEIFPKQNGQFCFFPGPRTDVLSGCNKAKGITMVLRNMTPSVIAVDEITHKDDCEAIIQAGWCGAELYATVHARDIKDLHTRPIYRSLIQTGIFQNYVVLGADKRWHLERVSL